MNSFLTLAFLFFVGSLAGWCMELLFRHFTSKDRKWINPGFCVGPYLPIYGFGLCAMYLIASLERFNWIGHPVWNKAVLFLAMAVCMTAIEYIAGVVCLKFWNLRLWDYSNFRGNIQGIICPQFSLIWAALGGVYDFLIHPHILDALGWLSRNLACSFFIGLFYGVFLIDVAYSAQIVTKIKAFAVENEVVVRYEALKDHIHTQLLSSKEKIRFFFPLRSSRPLQEHLKEMRTSLEQVRRKKGN